MAKTLLLGLGGTGSRVVNNVVLELNSKNARDIVEGNLCCAVLDTNDNDRGLIDATGSAITNIATSRDQNIDDYLARYSHRSPRDWCPYNAALGRQTMTNGASELRVKSRIAFMDVMSTNTIRELEQIIENMLTLTDGSQIRVMLISSLSGGTGSGMFIQVALWLRRFFESRRCEISIRGILLLPDIFINNIDDIRNSATSKLRHYANAYAAIREVNALSKIKMRGNLPGSERVEIEGLFDSDADASTGKQVFDFAFFIDAVDQNGASLSSIHEYEKMAAQLAYMQLCAPLKDNLYSEEDNLFLAYTNSPDPLYGSCGTSKAVYPTEEVLNYCALRATAEVLQTGWRKLDQEIADREAAIKAKELDSIYGEKIDPVATYVKLFEDEISKTAAEVGKYRLFLSIAGDVKNVTLQPAADGKQIPKYSNKVDDYINLLVNEKVHKPVTAKGNLNQLHLPGKWSEKEHDVEDLNQCVKKYEELPKQCISDFEKKVDGIAADVVDAVFPLDMGKISLEDKNSIYSLFVKKDEDGKTCFVHPLAARYMIYKLTTALREKKNAINLADGKKRALSGEIPGKPPVTFDNPATKETEKDPAAYLASQTAIQKLWGKEKFIKHFVGQYVMLTENRYAMCESYQRNLLFVKVCEGMIENLTLLVDKMQTFFKQFDQVFAKVNEGLSKNLERRSAAVGKTLYVYAGEGEKETVYESLGLQLDGENSALNRSLIDTIYGSMCVEKRPSAAENAKYKDTSIVDVFYAEVMNSYKHLIETKYADKVDLSIYQAICAEADAAAGVKSESAVSVDPATGKLKTNTAADQRRHTAMRGYVDKLDRMAAPFLQATIEQSDNRYGAVTSRDKKFWGLSEELAKECPELGSLLGVNVEIQKNALYRKNELYCYRAVYGLSAKYIPKFNEMKGGAYYTSYKFIIDDMITKRDSARNEDEREGALVQTPHLDKRWHTILPFVTEDMQDAENARFCKTLWLALAYGHIKLDGKRYQIRRPLYSSVKDAYETVPLKLNGEYVSANDVSGLIKALKLDEMFMVYNAEKLAAEYGAELKDMVTYEGTSIYQYMKKKGEINPVDMVVRYAKTRGTDKNVTSELIAALEKITADLVENYNMIRDEEQTEKAKNERYKAFLAAGSLEGKKEVFESWVTKTKSLKD